MSGLGKALVKAFYLPVGFVAGFLLVRTVGYYYILIVR